MKRTGIEWVVVVLGIVVLLPFLVMCFYNHPATDDFGFANTVNIHGFWGTQKYMYDTWKCAFVSSMLMSITPLMINWYLGYKIIPFILFFIYMLLIYWFVNTLTDGSLKPLQKWTIVAAFIISYFYYVPYPGHAFYWLPTVISYQVPTLLVIIFLTLLLKLKREIKHQTRLTFFLALLTASIMQGCESYMAFMFGLITMLLLLSTVINKRINKIYLILFFIAVMGVVLVLTCPGIYVRAKTGNGEFNESPRYFSVALKFLFLEILDFIYRKTWVLILLFMVLLPSFDILYSRLKESIKGISLPLTNPFISLFITITFSSVFIFPMCYINQYHPFGRVSNVSYFYFLTGFLYVLVCLWGYFKSKYNINLDGKTYKRIQWTALCVAAMMLLLPNNVRAAYADLILGRASDYNDQLNNRYELLAACKDDTCVIPPVRQATTLGFMDMTTKTSAWENRAYSLFFGKKAIRLSSDGHTKNKDQHN